MESADEKRVKDRLETSDLFAHPTETLLGIRGKWKRNEEITRVEWMVLTQYAEQGCERLSSYPELPSRESFAQVLEAFLAVWSLHGASDMDRYYLGNLSGWSDEEMQRVRTQGQPDPEIVPRVVRQMIRDLRESPATGRPAYAARNISVAVRDERFEGAVSLHSALLPFFPCLYGLAARGHWLVEQRPIRAEPRPWQIQESVQPRVPDAKAGDLQLSSVLGQEGELEMLLQTQQIGYPLGPYPRIREFMAMVKTLAPGRAWNGPYFLGHTDDLVPAGDRRSTTSSTFYFREHGKGVLVKLTAEEWCDLRSLFEQAAKMAELQAAFGELALAYGEV
jgi:hypothetical protein